jgi:DNA-directed RNA polymerase subunit RPC12/RpoP
MTSSPPSLMPIERPLCARCRTRMKLAHVAPAPRHQEKRLFECPHCNFMYTVTAPDPIKSPASGLVIQRTATTSMKVKTGPWTEAENERLRELVAQGASPIRLAAVFNRKIVRVRTQARKLGLSFPKKFSYRQKFAGDPSWRQ